MLGTRTGKAIGVGQVGRRLEGGDDGQRCDHEEVVDGLRTD